MKYITALSMIFVILSCTKDKVSHPFAGMYDCTKTTSTYGATGNSSTTEQVMIEVLLDGDTIDVLGMRVHEDEVKEGKTFTFGFASNYAWFYFNNDSLYADMHSGGLGGGYNTYYEGQKVD